MSRNAFNPFIPTYRQRFRAPITVVAFCGAYLPFGSSRSAGRAGSAEQAKGRVVRGEWRVVRGAGYHSPLSTHQFGGLGSWGGNLLACLPDGGAPSERLADAAAGVQIAKHGIGQHAEGLVVLSEQ